MKLQDQTYENENGQRVNRAEINCVGTYEYIADGFFTWECGECKEEHSTRAVVGVNGIVWTCRKCGKKNLLLRTDAQYFNMVMRKAETRNTELDDAMRRALGYMGQAISALSK